MMHGANKMVAYYLKTVLFCVQCHDMSLYTSWSSLLGMAGV